MEDKKDRKKDYPKSQEDMELAQELAGFPEDLMLAGGNNYLNRDEALKMVKKIQNRTRPK